MSNMIKKLSGITLIELMISLALGLIISLAAIGIFVSNKESFKFQEALAQLQENGRFASTVIFRDIQNAGAYDLCGGNVNITNTIEGSASGALPVDMEFYLRGFDGLAAGLSAALPTYLNDVAADIKPGTDVIFINSQDGCGAPVRKDPSPTAAALLIAENPYIEATSCIKDCVKAMVVICPDAALFAITSENISGNNGPAGKKGTIVHNTGAVCKSGLENWTKELGKDYSGGRLVIPTQNMYYIGTGANGRPSLFVRNTNDGAAGYPLELVEGVYDMQLTYYLDTDDNGQVDKAAASSEFFVDAGQIAASDWDQVIAARLYLLLETEDEVHSSDDADDFWFNAGSPTLTNTKVSDPADNRIRKMFTSTIALRNKVK